MNRHGRVVWREGELLSPQHFQQFQRSIDHQIAERFHQARDYDWGLTELSIDREALNNGQIRVTSARGVFRDGTVFQIGQEDAPPPPRTVEEHLDARDGSTTVHLGMPSIAIGRPTVGDDANGGFPSRYVTWQLELPDENTASNERTVAVAQRNLRLLFADEMKGMGEYDTIPIAVIERRSAGGFQERAGFVPPALGIAASPWLVDLLQDLRNRLETRSRERSAKRRPAGDAMEPTEAGVVATLQLQAVNETIPLLAHLLQRGREHPEQAYLLLAALAGRLCTISPTRLPQDVPAYRHDAIGPCFRDLHAMLIDLLNIGGRENSVAIPLTLQEMYHVGRLDDPGLVSGAEFYLGARADLDETELREIVPRQIKVASKDQIRDVVRLALPGVPLHHVATPPAQLHSLRGRVWFSLDRESELWEAIQGSRTIAVHAPKNIAGLTLDLYGVTP